MSVAIAGAGALCSLGIGLEELDAAVKGNENGIRYDELYKHDTGRIGDLFQLTDFTETKYHYLDPVTAYTIAAVSMARENLPDPTIEKTLEAGMIFGSQWGCTSTMEAFQKKLMDADPKFATPFLFSNSFPNSPASTVAIEFGLKGYNMVYAGSNAGFMSVLNGYRAVRDGWVQQIAAAGADALSATVLAGNNGLTGEGAACLWLTETGPVYIQECRLGNEYPASGAVYMVTDSEIILPDKRTMLSGNLMGAAFITAVCLAWHVIQTGECANAQIRFNNGSCNGWLSLSQ